MVRVNYIRIDLVKWVPLFGLVSICIMVGPVDVDWDRK